VHQYGFARFDCATMNAFKGIFAVSTSHHAIGMMILQIRPMMSELVHCALSAQCKAEQVALRSQHVTR
jgi:hypothetical protein